VKDGLQPSALEAPDRRPGFFARHNKLVAGIATVGLIVGITACSSSDSDGPRDEAAAVAGAPASEAGITPDNVFDQAAEALYNAQEEAPEGGSRFQSAIQAPHYQTDRDVGASGIGMAFLIKAEQNPEDPKWLEAANNTADWLVAVAQKDEQGRMFWPDYDDGDEASESAYTSFDDGTLGVGDFFWNLHEQTNDPAHKETALSAVSWTLAQAENIGTDAEPVYRWQWDVNDDESGHQMGMGMGAVGIVRTLALFHERVQDSDPAFASTLKQYIDGGVRYIKQTQGALADRIGADYQNALPETGDIDGEGGTNVNAGYLSGVAGLADMYLELYRVFDDEQYLAEAKEALAWLGLPGKPGAALVQPEEGGVAWKLALDPEGGDNPALATGIEEGSAGIGLTYLKAYELTGDPAYLEMAKATADWLIAVDVDSSPERAAWNENEDEDPDNDTVHANANNGAAGIGSFFQKLGELTGDAKYQSVAFQARNSLANTARVEDGKVFWIDNGGDGEDDYKDDPGWHWGLSGIVVFGADMKGVQVDLPGQQFESDAA
jgi:lantibiotic modifying enzyme